uniref:Ribosomal RNA small subunit methyltransferase E n=1 Tax=Neobacillus citreus TaxID=2833578 RepID=A0A942T1G6_9BACI
MASLYLVGSLDEVSAGDDVTLDGAEGRHAVAVARVRVGETLRLSDGRGTVATGRVESTTRDSLVLTVTSTQTQPIARPSLALVQALAKGGRDEMAVQAATEIGVDRITPWAASRSVSRWEGPKVEKGRARWAAIAQEASKQAIRARVPVVSDLVTTAQLAAGAVDGPQVALLVLDPAASLRLAEWDAPTDVDEIALVVGPEGGIDDGEFDRLVAAGAVRVRLGETVLRTSTAGPAALAILQTRLGRW